MSDAAERRLVPCERPPVAAPSLIAWARANLFSSLASTAATVLALLFIAELAPPFLRWAVLDGTWSAGGGQQCRSAGGACWAFIGVWFRFILFGRFPYAEQWRPLVVVFIFLGMFLASCDRRLWGRRLVAIWALGAALVLVLMFGGVLGMSFVDTALWNGLPLTLILAVFGMLLAFPLAILLALGRRSSLPVVRALAVAYIELIRGVPLVSLLFMASVMLPLFLPSGLTIDKLLRAQVAIVLFSAAYIAEIVRGGLQALGKGQHEAADALGFGYWRKMRLVILPQALALVVPPLVNTFIGTFKDTSLVIIIGLFDLLSTATAALNDPNWRGFYWEAYIFVGFLYWCFCFFMSRYSRSLERGLDRGERR
ncbi:MAG: amino acid ABC transporter permease [Alphaproteobacteria bacterium]|nr:amino acid ABC transporter permease [Alphaproteobacteria bacterium]